MKIPETPPDIYSVLNRLRQAEDDKKYLHILNYPQTVDSGGRYLHWEDLKYKNPPEGFSSEEWWAGIRFARSNQMKKTAFTDKDGNPFYFCMNDALLELLHSLDRDAVGQFSLKGLETGRLVKTQILIRSLVDEAITSSQLEGATTTRKKAKEMIFHQLEPKDNSERMIINNYRAMQFVQEHRHEQLTPKLVYELQRILTDKTLGNPDASGRLRNSDEFGVYDNRDNTLLHTPPKAAGLPERMKLLCDFANDKQEGYFLHPLVKAIILHFMIAYDHPFEDGNGRAARALFYRSAINSGYILVEYISISEIIKKAPYKYGRAFLETETDGNDLTYFIIHQMDVLKKAIDNLWSYIRETISETDEILKRLDSRARLKTGLNPRQLSLLRHAIKNPGFIYTIESHRRYHGTVYETSRKDLTAMSDKYRFLLKSKRGKELIFISPADLSKRLEKKR